jgi:plasmid replication initiation protein
MKKNYIVSKANKLITSKYELSLQEQRIILSLVSLVDSKDQRQFYEYEMTVKEFSELLNVENTNHTYLSKVTKRLMEKVVEIEDDKKLTQVHWLSSCVYYKGQGKVKLELHRELMPYLLQLKEQFTTYYLSNILQMKSKHSIRLYEILKSEQFKGNFKIDIDKLRKMMNCESYSRFSNFNQKVLKPAVKEIKKQSDILVNYKMVKEGNKTVALRFDVVSKRKLEQELYAE